MKNKPSDRMIAVINKAGDANPEIARAGMRELVTALQTPLRESVFVGDIADFYTVDPKPPGTSTDYPTDLVTPGNEGDWSAYFIPSIGAMPQRVVEGQFLTIPTYEVGATITIPMKYIRDAGWLTMKNYLNVMEASFTMKANTDAWRPVISAALNRNIVVYDDGALPGYASKKLVALAQIAMLRNTGGNTSSVNRGKLSRIYVSPESMGDIRSWNFDELDDVTRREFFMSNDADRAVIFGTDIRAIVELGVGGEFQNYYQNNLGGTFQSYTYTGAGAGTKVKLEIAIGLDLSRDNVFISPERVPIELFEDTTFHSRRKVHIYGWREIGYGVMDARKCLLLQI